MKALKSTPMRAAVYVVPLIAGLFGSAGIAVAQEPTPDQQSAIRSNCRSDFMANCSGVPRGGMLSGAAIACPFGYVPCGETGQLCCPAQ